jgi:prephenate dehydratase
LASYEGPKQKASIYMTISDHVGSLNEVLSQLKELKINLNRIESRPSTTRGDYEFYLDFFIKDTSHLDEVYSV